jgi:hypothetical protein
MINIDTLYPLAPAAHVAIMKQPFIGLSHCHTPPLVNEVPVPSQKSEPSCICVLGVSIFPFSTICFYILELFRESGNLSFCLILFEILLTRR